MDPINAQKRLHRTPKPVRLAGIPVLSGVLLYVAKELGIFGFELLLSALLSTVIFFISLPFHEFLHSLPLKKHGYKYTICVSFLPPKGCIFSDTPVRLKHFRQSLALPVIPLGVLFVFVLIFIATSKPFWLFLSLIVLVLGFYEAITDLWQLLQTANCPADSWVANTRHDTVVFENRKSASLYIKTVTDEYS